MKSRGTDGIFIVLVIILQTYGDRRGIVLIKETFEENIRFNVGSEDKIFFWTDTWIGDRPPAKLFPNLYNCPTKNQAKVVSYTDRNASQVQLSSKEI